MEKCNLSLNLNTYNTEPSKSGHKNIFCQSFKGSPKDIFVKKTQGAESVVDCARSFRKIIIEPFNDWVNCSLPEDGQKGCNLLKKLLDPYISTIKDYNASDTKKFVQLTLGIDTAKTLDEAALKNSSLRLFKDTIEEKIGKNIQSFVSGK